MDDLERQLKESEGRLTHLQIEFQALQVSLVGLETPVRELQAEWEDMFEKYRNLYGRISKRIKREEEPEPEVVAQPLTPTIPADINPMAERLLRRSG